MVAILGAVLAHALSVILVVIDSISGGGPT